MREAVRCWPSEMRVELDWIKTDRVLADAFGPSVYIVGGPVRDKLRSLFHGDQFDPKDRDYVIVGHSIDEIRAKLGERARIDAVGASFGVLKVTVPDEATVDVALPRRERSTGSGHRDFEVQSGPDVTIEEDQARRDFLMNALGVQLISGELVAHAGAIEDVRHKRITAINGRRSFVDDPLRMLRAAQFSARFGFQVEDETRRHMLASASLIANVSPERISEELGKMLVKSARPSEGIRILHDVNLLAAVIPGLEEGAGVEQNDFHAHDVLQHNLAALDASRSKLEARWAALLHDIGKPRARSRDKTSYGYTFHGHERVGADMSRQILTNLRLPNALVDRVSRLVANHMYVADPAQSDSAIKRLINRVGLDLLEEQFHLRRADKIASGLPQGRNLERNEQFERRVYDLLAARPALAIRDLAVDGRDVMRAMIDAGVRPPGFQPGPEVGSILRDLLDRVIDAPELNTRDALKGEMIAIIHRMKGGA